MIKTPVIIIEIPTILHSSDRSGSLLAMSDNARNMKSVAIVAKIPRTKVIAAEIFRFFI
jgi:preprotein translocase subunit Sec63